MDNVLIALIKELPPGYLMAMIPVFAALGVWVFTHIRRDKHGKVYFYSQKYEDTKRNRKQDAILSEVSKLTADMVDMKKFREDAIERLGEQTVESKEARKEMLQLQVCAMNLPATAKREAYREYKKLGFNSWVDDYVVADGLFSREEISWVRGQSGGAGGGA